MAKMAIIEMGRRLLLTPLGPTSAITRNSTSKYYINH